MAMARALICAIATLLGACASIGSQTISNNDAQGMPYQLPKVMFELTLRGVTDASNYDSNVVLAVEPYYTGDSRAGALALGYTPGVLTQDTINIEIDQRQLLRAVSGQFNSRARQTFAGLGRVAGLIESGEGIQYDISPAEVDPADPASLHDGAQRLTRALHDWAAREYQQLNRASAPRRRQLYRTAFDSSFALEWRWHGDTAPEILRTERVNPPSSDCGSAVCTRALRNGSFIVWRCAPVRARLIHPGAQGVVSNAPAQCGPSNGVSISEVSLAIPNGGRSIGVPVRGGMFADRTRSLAFVNGLIVDFDATGGSEPEGFLGAVGAAIVAVPAGAIERVQGEESVLRAQTAATEQETRLIRAQQGLEAARRGDAAPESDEEEADDGAGTPESGEAGEAPQPARTTPASGGAGQPAETEAEAETETDALGGTTTPRTAPVTTPAEITLRSWSAPLFGPIRSAIRVEN